MRPHRSSNTPDPYLVWKVALFVAAAGLWIDGAATGDTRLTGAAIVFAAAALLLRFMPSGRRTEDRDESD
jgi:hypothetical protein